MVFSKKIDYSKAVAKQESADSEQYKDLSKEDEEVLEQRSRIAKAVTPAQSAEWNMLRLAQDTKGFSDEDVRKTLEIPRCIWQSDCVEALFDYYDRATIEGKSDRDVVFDKYKKILEDAVLINRDVKNNSLVSYKDTKNSISDDPELKGLFKQDGKAAERYKMRMYIARSYQNQFNLVKDMMPNIDSFNDECERYRVVKEHEFNLIEGIDRIEYPDLWAMKQSKTFAPVQIQKDLVQNHVAAYIDRWEDGHTLEDLKSLDMQRIMGRLVKDVAIGIEPKVIVESMNDRIVSKYGCQGLPICCPVNNFVNNANWFGIEGSELRKVHERFQDAVVKMDEKNGLMDIWSRKQMAKNIQQGKDVKRKTSELKPMSEHVKRVRVNLQTASIGKKKNDGNDGPNV